MDEGDCLSCIEIFMSWSGLEEECAGKEDGSYREMLLFYVTSSGGVSQ